MADAGQIRPGLGPVRPVRHIVPIDNGNERDQRQRRRDGDRGAEESADTETHGSSSPGRVGGTFDAYA